MTKLIGDFQVATEDEDPAKTKARIQENIEELRAQVDASTSKAEKEAFEHAIRLESAALEKFEDVEEMA